MDSEDEYLLVEADLADGQSSVGGAQGADAEGRGSRASSGDASVGNLSDFGDADEEKGGDDDGAMGEAAENEPAEVAAAAVGSAEAVHQGRVAAKADEAPLADATAKDVPANEEMSAPAELQEQWQQQQQQEQHQTSSTPAAAMSAEDHDAGARSCPSATTTNCDQFEVESRLPTNSAFHSDHYDDLSSCEDDNWDSVSKIVDGFKEADRIDMFCKLVEEMSMHVAHQAQAAFPSLMEFVLVYGSNALESKDRADTDTDAKASCKTEEDLRRELLRLLQNKEVVETLQEFVHQPCVADLIIDAAKAGEIGSTQDVLRASLTHGRSVLTALAQLAKDAPGPVTQLVFKLAAWWVRHFFAPERESSTAAAAEPAPAPAPAHEPTLQVVAPPALRASLAAASGAPPQRSVEPQGPAVTMPPRPAPARSSAQRNASNDVVHYGVRCDGCSESDDRLAVSLSNGHTHGRYIRGIRWKSGIAFDFDLCSSCEQTGAFEEKYGPFLKICSLAKAPRNVRVELQSRWPRPTLSSLGLFGSRPQPPPRAPPQRASQAAAGSEGGMCCPQGHKMTQFTATAAFQCDACAKDLSHGSKLVGCRLCNFDLCEDCRQAQLVEPQPAAQPAAQPAIATSVPALPQATVAAAPPALPSAAPSTKAARPRAKFVADISLADGTLLQPGHEVEKVWRIVNSGESCWPDNVRLVSVGGHLLNAENGKAVPALRPNQQYDLSLPMRAPEEPGRYVSYWRLMTGGPNGMRFGHRLWIDVTVEPKIAPAAEEPQAPEAPPAPAAAGAAAPAAAEAAAPAAAPAAGDESGSEVSFDESLALWSDQIGRMVEVGFCDLHANIRALEASKGNLDDAVSRLLHEDN